MQRPRGVASRRVAALEEANEPKLARVEIEQQKKTPATACSNRSNSIRHQLAAAGPVSGVARTSIYLLASAQSTHLTWKLAEFPISHPINDIARIAVTWMHARTNDQAIRAGVCVCVCRTHRNYQ